MGQPGQAAPAFQHQLVLQGEEKASGLVPVTSSYKSELGIAELSFRKINFVSFWRLMVAGALMKVMWLSYARAM